MSDQPISLVSWKDKVKFLFSLQTKTKHLLIGFTSMTAITSVLSAVTPYFLKLQIDQLQNKNQELLNIPSNPLLLFFILLVIPVIIDYIQSYIIDRNQNNFRVKLSTTLRLDTEKFIWNKIATLDAGFFQSKRNKKLYSDALGSTGVVSRSIEFLSSRFGEVIRMTVILPLLALVSWQIMVLILVVAIVQLLISRKMRKHFEGISLAESMQNDQEWKVRRILEDNYFDIKANGELKKILSEQRSLSELVSLADVRRFTSELRLRSFAWIMDNGVILLTNMFVGYQVMFGDVSLGTFTLVVAYTNQIYSFFYSAISTVNEWQEIDFDLTKLSFFLSLKSRLKKEAPALDVPQAAKSLELKEVSFSYPSQSEEEKQYLTFLTKRLNKWMSSKESAYYRYEISDINKILSEHDDTSQVLSNVSLEVHQGKITALVGRNGSGKTTSTHLLQHHYEPDSGQVLLSGQELYRYDHDQVTDLFSWLTQTPFILDRYSIERNFLLGSEDTPATRQRLKHIVKELKLDSFIESLPKKYQSIIDEDTSLSGGQMQLIGIARALLQERQFIIFDEGSSQLDVEKEFLVMKQLQKAKEKAGILFITHRMSVARRADYIYVIDGGKIIQEGTHKELLEQTGGLYAQFWGLQVIEE